MTLSPHLDDKHLDDPRATPAAHSPDEIRRMIRLVSARNVHSVIIGHGADPESTAVVRESADVRPEEQE